ncbi:sushi, von Willebrand factor type A, EGF and pentraxin domain-containing protein 1-like [Pecten maximus]|uniref:sushi, von Willebrand factor type A, EGF and pentraxin domain-containing protein 1-like n=1 Tax=Pecten maximus TaxID=6579 RepID=UPI001458CCFF|nr:sushi, von Willebrand factor type A, EGF and pentraxin domain-containing protein 1-like [Pecten maximus]
MDTRLSSYNNVMIEGVTGCGQICALDGRCVAINYHPGTLTCEMVEAGAAVANDTLGWTHISNLAFVSHMIGSCSGESVSENFACVKLTSGSHTVVIKYCPPLPPIAYGTVPVEQREVGVTVMYSCDTGYVGFGEASRTCGADGQWKGSTFECRDCGAPPDVTSGVVLSGNNTVGSKRFYLCGTLTSPDVNAFVTCQTNGHWSTPGFVCVDDTNDVLPPSNNNEPPLTNLHVSDTAEGWPIASASGRLKRQQWVKENVIFTDECSYYSGIPLRNELRYHTEHIHELSLVKRLETGACSAVELD